MFLLGRQILSCLSVLAFCLYMSSVSSAASYQEERSIKEGYYILNSVPPFAQQKNVYNVGYFEAGPYWEFDEIYKAIVHDLSKYPQSKALAFPKKYHYSPGWISPKAQQEKIAADIMQNPDIDVVIAMGTVASTMLLAHNNGQKTVICLNVADATYSGLINPNTHRPVAKNFVVDHFPQKWRRSIEILNILQSFQHIGTMAPDTPEGLAYCNIHDLREVGRARGFEVSFYDQIDIAESVESCKRGIEYLIKQDVDAVYVPALNCFDPELGNPDLLYEILHENNIKTYAKDGKIPVMYGALIGISTLNYTEIGTVFAQILLRHLPNYAHADSAIQLEFEPKIYLNNDTARKLKIQFPLPLLTNVDSIYDDMLPPIKY